MLQILWIASVASAQNGIDNGPTQLERPSVVPPGTPQGWFPYDFSNERPAQPKVPSTMIDDGLNRLDIPGDLEQPAQAGPPQVEDPSTIIKEGSNNVAPGAPNEPAQLEGPSIITNEGIPEALDTKPGQLEEPSAITIPGALDKPSQAGQAAELDDPSPITKEGLNSIPGPEQYSEPPAQPGLPAQLDPSTISTIIIATSPIQVCGLGQEFDTINRACVPVSCRDVNACPPDKVCTHMAARCIRAPCPQFVCRDPVKGHSAARENEGNGDDSEGGGARRRFAQLLPMVGTPARLDPVKGPAGVAGPEEPKRVVPAGPSRPAGVAGPEEPKRVIPAGPSRPAVGAGPEEPSQAVPAGSSQVVPAVPKRIAPARPDGLVGPVNPMAGGGAPVVVSYPGKLADPVQGKTGDGGRRRFAQLPLMGGAQGRLDPVEEPAGGAGPEEPLRPVPSGPSRVMPAGPDRLVGLVDPFIGGGALDQPAPVVITNPGKLANPVPGKPGSGARRRLTGSFWPPFNGQPLPANKLPGAGPAGFAFGGAGPTKQLGGPSDLVGPTLGDGGAIGLVNSGGLAGPLAVSYQPVTTQAGLVGGPIGGPAGPVSHRTSEFISPGAGGLAGPLVSGQPLLPISR